MIWSFLLKVLGVAFVIDWIFSLALIPFLGLTAVLAAKTARPTIMSYCAIAAAGAFQVYFWGAWAAYCAAQATAYVASPETSQHWLYYSIAFLAAGSPLAYLEYKETASAQSPAEVGDIRRGASFYSWGALVAFAVFSVWPASMNGVYGWLVRWLVSGV